MRRAPNRPKPRQVRKVQGVKAAIVRALWDLLGLAHRVAGDMALGAMVGRWWVRHMRRKMLKLRVDLKEADALLRLEGTGAMVPERSQRWWWRP